MQTLQTFGSFELDPRGPTLRRNGEPVHIGQRALALLMALVEAGGAVVSKPMLMDRAWPGLFVEEANLSVQISQLRRLLGPRLDGQDWIMTVPGLGYRFVPYQPAPARPPQRPGIVVLPFNRAESDTQAGYLADGVVTDLIAALTRFHSFSVISRSIAFTYRGRSVDSRQVANELNLRYVLEGSLQRDGTRLRVTTQMVDGIAGTQIWAWQFDGTLDDIFAMQDHIVENIAVRVEPAIHAREIARARLERPTSIAAYDIYLRALDDLTDESEAANRRAFGLLSEALNSEPNNAAMLAQAAWALEHRHTMGWPALGPDDIGTCLLLARRGLQHAQGNAVIMAQCGMALLQAGRDYESGLAVIRAAVAANPHALFANAAAGVAEIHCGTLEQAELHLRRVLDLAPLDPDTRFALSGLAMIAIIRGDYELALARAGHSLAVNPHFDATHWMLIAANALLGRMDAANHYLDGLYRLAPATSLSAIRDGQPAMIPGRIDPVLKGLELAGMRP